MYILSLYLSFLSNADHIVTMVGLKTYFKKWKRGFREA